MQYVAIQYFLHLLLSQSETAGAFWLSVICACTVSSASVVVKMDKLVWVKLVSSCHLFVCSAQRLFGHPLPFNYMFFLCALSLQQSHLYRCVVVWHALKKRDMPNLVAESDFPGRLSKFTAHLMFSTVSIDILKDCVHCSHGSKNQPHRYWQPEWEHSVSKAKH